MIGQETESSAATGLGVQQQESSTNQSETTTVVSAPESIEILQIYVPSGQPNAVKLIWGHNTDKKLNFTYGIHYGIDESDLECKSFFYHFQFILIIIFNI